MDRVTDFIRRNPFAWAKGQETEKSSLFKDTWEKYSKAGKWIESRDFRALNPWWVDVQSSKLRQLSWWLWGVQISNIRWAALIARLFLTEIIATGANYRLISDHKHFVIGYDTQQNPESWVSGTSHSTQPAMSGKRPETVLSQMFITTCPLITLMII